MPKCPPNCTCGKHTARQPQCPEGCACGRHAAFSEERRRNISEAQKQGERGAAMREFLATAKPQLCACGCGEYATVDARRRRIGKYVSGHNAKVNHPMQGKHHTEETKAVLAKKALAQMEHQFPDRTPKHLRNSGTHSSWNWMMSRCFDSWNASYPHYGGRGITVCERWLTFANFLGDMGARPDGMSLDRIDGTGNYEPGNCRWATREEQNANRKDPGGWEARRARKASNRHQSS